MNAKPPSKKKSQSQKPAKAPSIRGALGLGMGFDGVSGGPRSGISGQPSGLGLPGTGSTGIPGMPGHAPTKQHKHGVVGSRSMPGAEGSRNLRAGVQRPQGDRGSGS